MSDALAQDQDVAVYELSREWTTPEVLCERHRAERALTWSVKQMVGPFPAWLDCGDCNRERQAAPGYVTPVVPFSPTRPGSRLLTPDEYARIERPSELPRRAPAPKRRRSAA